MEWFFASQNAVGSKFLKKYFLTGKSRTNSYNKVQVGYPRILMSYKRKKRKGQIKNLSLPFLYPEPGSNRHSIATTGV